MEVNATYYESTAIGHHYRSKKSLALAYLMTIGSKALVLMEVNEGEQHSNPVSVQQSFDDEAAIKRKMIQEESVRLFERSLGEKPGVAVIKRGRNGECRHINIRFKDDPKRGRVVSWHSRITGKKYFLVDRSLSVQLIKDHRGVEAFATDIPILRLENSSRQLEVQFKTANEANVCLYLLQAMQLRELASA